MPKLTDKKPRTSKYPGVSKLGTKYVAQFKHKAKTHYLGIHHNEENAARAYYIGVRNSMAQGLLSNPKNWQAKIKWYENNFPELINNTPAMEAQSPIDWELLLADEDSIAPPKFKYRGVTWYTQRQVWKASVIYHKEKYFAGAYKSIVDAVNAYNSKVDELFVQFKDEKLLQKKHKLPELPADTAEQEFYDLDLEISQHQTNSPRLLYTPLHDFMGGSPSLMFDSERLSGPSPTYGLY